jgi:hypothetical protein
MKLTGHLTRSVLDRYDIARRVRDSARKLFARSVITAGRFVKRE